MAEKRACPSLLSSLGQEAGRGAGFRDAIRRTALMPGAVASLGRCWCRVGRFALLVFTLGACATGNNGSFWGADATIAPGWDRIARAAVDAAKDPFTWAPAVG